MTTRPIDDTLRSDLAGLDAESRAVDANGLRLHVLDYPGEGRGVVVLPGITSPAISWDFVVRAVRGKWRFVVCDIRGRGLSQTPADGGYTLADYSADLAGVIDALGLDRPTLLGHSMGARIVTAFAAQHPGVAGAVIAVDPPMSGPGRSDYPITRDAFMRQLREARAGTTLDELRSYYPRWPDRELELRSRWLPTCSDDAVGESHDSFHDEDFFDYWPQVGPPVAFVYGGESPMVTAAGAAEAAERNSAARMLCVPGAGHMIPWDNFDGFVEAVGGLLDGDFGPADGGSE
jgi:N-formylmaleamate deformylase